MIDKRRYWIVEILQNDDLVSKKWVVIAAFYTERAALESQQYLEYIKGNPARIGR